MNGSGPRPSPDDLLANLDIVAFYSAHVEGFSVNGHLNVKCICPFGCGTDNSFSIDKEKGLYFCHRCNAKGSAWGFLKARGYGPAQIASTLSDYQLGGNVFTPLAKEMKPETPAAERRRYPAIPEILHGNTKVAEYAYTLNDGTGSALKVRYLQPDGEKTFLWFERDGDGFLGGLGGKEPDLYGLAAVRAAIERGAQVVLNEGEKAADRANRHGGDDTRDFVATCGHTGKTSFRGPRGEQIARQLAGGCGVLAVVDRDPDGEIWAEDVRRHLEARVPSLQFVQSRVTTCKADLYDHLEAGYGLGELVRYRTQGQPVAAHAPHPSSNSLDDVFATFDRWLYLPDRRSVLVVLGGYAANRLQGDPVWLLLVGPSGLGKTEPLNALTGVEFIHVASTLTEASLLSGTPKREKAKEAKGGLLRVIGEFGILVCKDFTSVLSLHRDARASVLSALREVYDGAFTRHVGTDGGKTLSWSGRVGFLGGVTPILDLHHAVMSAMGERFLLFRLPQADRRALARTALKHSSSSASMRAELAESVEGLIGTLDFNTPPRELTEEEIKRVIGLADFAARARSPVERNGYSREVELIPGAEAPTRLSIGLVRLLAGVRLIGADDVVAWSTIEKVAFDCIPAVRRAALVALADGAERDTTSVSKRVGYPTATARRALEDLTAYGLIQRTSAGPGKSDKWCLSDENPMPAAFSEMSGGK